MLELDRIKEIIPHREPFIFIDRIVYLEEGVKAEGEWELKPDYFFFKGHFPEYPVVPGVIIAESLAQTGAVAILSKESNKGKIAFFAGIDRLKFRRQVRPGEKLVMTMEIVKTRKNYGKGNGVAYVNNEVVAEGNFSFALA